MSAKHVAVEDIRQLQQISALTNVWTVDWVNIIRYLQPNPAAASARSGITQVPLDRLNVSFLVSWTFLNVFAIRCRS